MQKMLKLIAPVVVICFASGLLLATVNRVTAPSIANANEKRKVGALNIVLPAHDNTPLVDTLDTTFEEQSWTFHIARQNQALVGAAVESSVDSGYAGKIIIMVGIKADGSVNAISILEQKETPGLGAKIEEPTFKDQFQSRSLKNTVWKVKKDGGDIDQITAATISSKAVTEAVHRALEAFAATPLGTGD